MAGFTGAIIVLPQGVAFALIAGLPPIYGLYTAMITPIVAALFGSSHHLVSGPTTPISILIFSALNQHAEPGSIAFIQLALVITLMAGATQFFLGLVKMGALVNFVSHSVIVGFTTGAAILIIVSQLKHVVGIDASSGGSLWSMVHSLWLNLSDLNPYFLIIALGTLVTAVLFRKFLPRLPYMLLGMITGSIIYVLIDGGSFGITTIGRLPANLPPFTIPPLTLDNIRLLAPNAFAIALLGLIEAVAISRSIALKTHQRISGNQEFIGQGLSNIVGSFFSCYAGSGSFTRSGLNHESGAKTPLAAVFSGLILLAIILLVAPLAAYLPIPAMAGIILLVAFNLIDAAHIKKILRASKAEATVLTITFLATLFLQLEFAIYFGVFFSLVFYLQRTTKPLIATIAPDPKDKRRKFFNINRKPLETCPQLKIIRIDGSLYYGAVNHIASTLYDLSKDDENSLLIVGNGINIIDVSGAEMLVRESKRWQSMGKRIYVSGLKKNAREFLQKGGYWEEIGDENFFTNKQEAIENIFLTLDPSICATCQARIFIECPPEQ